MKNIQEVLNGWFNFKGWSSHKREPVEYTNDLDEYGSFYVYQNFRDFLDAHDVYNYDYDTDEEVDLDVALSTEENFKKFVEKQINNSSYYYLNFNQINEEIIFAQASKTTEPIDYFITTSSIKSEDDLISFINDVLANNGQVTHSSGIKNEYEVVSIA